MENEVLTIREAAEFLKVSVSYLLKMVREGEIPVTKRGRRYTRLMKRDLVAFLQRHRKKVTPAKEVQE
ncbi:MAG: hypothetical protein DDT29_01835 [Dehalococcoidia bacterium]|nr:hypothetical protein [Bacillota bacterium]